jgi:hypothetical protein
MITPLAGSIALKPGSATLPFFGVQPAIVDEKGNELEVCEILLFTSLLSSYFADTFDLTACLDSPHAFMLTVSIFCSLISRRCMDCAEDVVTTVNGLTLLSA